MATALKGGVLDYVDQQIDALHHHVPAALRDFDATGIHQARVATRRLKAALDLLAAKAGRERFADLNRAGRKLRRLLGPLRDADVMIDHLRKYAVPEKTKAATAWLIDVLESDRAELRADDAGRGKPPEKRLRTFTQWWADRRAISELVDGIEQEIADQLLGQTTAFAAKADRLAGLTPSIENQKPLDVHELRIDGKALRYTFELAAAQGVRVPKRIFKSFKAMQESLGDWHDYVVLAEKTTACWAEREIALHDPALAGDVLDLAKLFLKDASKALNQFKSRWKRSGKGVRRVIETYRTAAIEISTEATSPDVAQAEAVEVPTSL